jgi:hypothetical protein
MKRSNELKNTIEEIPIGQLTPYEYNEKKHPEQQIHRLAKCIQKFGFIQPLVVDGKNNVIIGHGRLLAAQRLKMESIPAIRKEGLTEEEITELRLLDNKLNESEWDAVRLGLYGKDLLIDIGFTNKELEKLFDRGKMKDKGEEAEALEAMLLRGFEKYDYLVFVFRNEMDWLNAQQRFDVKQVNVSFTERKRRLGLGRVLEGSLLLRAITDTQKKVARKAAAEVAHGK